MKGALTTIDRPYGPVFDFLHHHIGSTHVAHHLNHTIPHYHAKEATEALKARYLLLSARMRMFAPHPRMRAPACLTCTE